MRLTSDMLAVAFCGWLVLGTAAAATPAAPDDAAGTTSAPTESQQRARARLNAMAQYIASLQRFSVTVHAGYDSVQADGEKIQFLENRVMRIERPSHLRLTESSDGGGTDIIFDGKKITIYDAGAQVFAQANQPATIDDSLIYFVRDLGMRLPLAPLFMSAFPERLDGYVTTVDYVESTRATGVPTTQVAARLETGVDLQMWIADGDQPLPQRIVLTYRNEPGQPQFFARFSDWNLQPKFDARTFVFDAPKAASPIAFEVQLPLISQPVRPPSAQSSEAKQ